MGLAALDLRGHLLSTSSLRGASESDVIAWILELGTPVIVATDVVPAPAFVQRVAARFGARLWVPQERISVERKEEIRRQFERGGVELDDHARDALSAAFSAFLDFAPKFRQIERRYSQDEELQEYVKAAVVRGESMARAERKFFSEREQGARSAVSPPAPSSRAEKNARGGSREDLLAIIAELRAELRRLRSSYDELLSDLRDVERERDELRELLRRLPRSEDAERYRMERDACRRELAAVRRRLRRVERLFEDVLFGRAVAVPAERVDSVLAMLRDSGQSSGSRPRRLGTVGRFVILRHPLLKGRYRYWVVRRHRDAGGGKPMSDDELAKRILDLVEEYRRSRLEDSDDSGDGLGAGDGDGF